MTRVLKYLFPVILIATTVALCEVVFRAYDTFTRPHYDIVGWILQKSKDLQEHPQLGYTYRPRHVVSDVEQADDFGFPNVPEAVTWKKVDVVGIGDSYVHNARQVFFDQFKSRSLKYRSLALFGYGPASYNILLKEYGAQLRPSVYLYFVYLGNDPGDIRRFEDWQASGKGWYAYNGGDFMPIERQGFFWGWRFFIGQAKAFARGLLNRGGLDGYARIKSLFKKGDAETVFEYVKQADTSAKEQKTPLLVMIIPRLPQQKPILDPVADKLVRMCAENGIDCLDLDEAFGDVPGRVKFFAPDRHWNEAGMEAALAFFWERRLAALLPAHAPRR